MNKTQMIKRAYVRGLAARGIYRARLRQKQAAGGLKDYAISGGIGAAGGGALGSLIGALVQYARGKNVLRGAGIGGAAGAGAGLLGGLGYQYSKKAPAETKPSVAATLIDGIVNPGSRTSIATGLGLQGGDATYGLEPDINSSLGVTPESDKNLAWTDVARAYKNFGRKIYKAMDNVNTQNAVDDAIVDEGSDVIESGNEPEWSMDQQNRLYTQQREQKERQEAATRDLAKKVLGLVGRGAQSQLEGVRNFGNAAVGAIRNSFDQLTAPSPLSGRDFGRLSNPKKSKKSKK
ncbi:MAG: hypothetical protein IJF84_00450 [Thermoguttaceae bacterium]|nr:hypothetical protein [Thermoguttaceae bacterium]